MPPRISAAKWVLAMPCYLFTYHAYGTWLPDRKRGYVKRHCGILPADLEMAAKYRSAMKESAAEFTSDVQNVIVDSILESQDKQLFEAYYVATDATHVHLLVGWRDERAWLHMRGIIKSSMSRRLNCELKRREWFAEGGSRKRVKDRAHFDHLVLRYLPKHQGWKWCMKQGKSR